MPPVGGIWLDGDRVIYPDGVGGVYAAPLAGGDPVVLSPLPPDDLPGGLRLRWRTFFTWSSVDGNLRRRPLTADGVVVERIVLPGTLATRIYVHPRPRRRVQRGDGGSLAPEAALAGARSDVTTSGDLLASTGDFTYVRYAGMEAAGRHRRFQ